LLKLNFGVNMKNYYIVDFEWGIVKYSNELPAPATLPENAVVIDCAAGTVRVPVESQYSKLLETTVREHNSSDYS
jgi:hypothetical protein